MKGVASHRGHFFPGYVVYHWALVFRTSPFTYLLADIDQHSTPLFIVHFRSLPPK